MGRHISCKNKQYSVIKIAEIEPRNHTIMLLLYILAIHRNHMVYVRKAVHPTTIFIIITGKRAPWSVMITYYTLIVGLTSVDEREFAFSK